MKNVHVLPTPNPSYLYKMSDGSLNISDLFEGGNSAWKNQNIYITSDEEIIGGKEWFLDLTDNSLFKNQVDEPMSKVLFPNCKKIILTTDRDLIKDGVQAIDDNFLEWFVKNPSREEVEIGNQSVKSFDTGHFEDFYKIIIPKEEPKQETLEEAFEKFMNQNFSGQLTLGFVLGAMKFGAKWQQETEKEMLFQCWKASEQNMRSQFSSSVYKNVTFDEWFEQYKNK